MLAYLVREHNQKHHPRNKNYWYFEKILNELYILRSIYIYVRTCRAVRQAQAHPVLFSYSLKQLRTKLRLFVNEPVSYIGFSVVPAFAVAVLVETPNIVNKVAWEQGPLVGPASLPAASCISAPLSGSWVPNGMTSDRLGPGRWVGAEQRVSKYVKLVSTNSSYVQGHDWRGLLLMAGISEFWVLYSPSMDGPDNKTRLRIYKYNRYGV